MKRAAAWIVREYLANLIVAAGITLLLFSVFYPSLRWVAFGAMFGAAVGTAVTARKAPWQ